MKLEFYNVNKYYGKNHALCDFTATLDPGIYALMGPNGSGKSTLMNILTDNIRADNGKILYDGENVMNMGVRFREKIGFMPQYPGMYPNFTVEQYLWYMATLKNIDRKKANFQIDEILQAVELSEVSRRRISALSGGMKQRLALAQAVLGSPEILILDEPTAGLDPMQRNAVRNYISKISLSKIVIIATHVVSDVEYIAKKIIFLKKGVIADFATATDLTCKINGKVWQIQCDVDRVAEYQKNNRGVNITGEGEIGRAHV